MPKFLTAAEVAQRIGKHEAEVRRDIYAGTLPATKQGQKWLIAPADVSRVYGVKLAASLTAEERIAQLEAEVAALRAKVATLEQRLQDTEQPTIKMPAVRAPEAPQTALPAPATALPIPRRWPAESPHSAPKLLTVMQFVARHLVDTKYLDGALQDAATVLPTKSTQEPIGKTARLKLLEHWRTGREPGVQRCREGCECVDYLPG